MTRLPGDIFLPSSSLEYDTHLSLPAGIASDSCPSTLSPFASPRGAMGYFDQSVYMAGPHSPRSPSTTGAVTGVKGSHGKPRTNHVTSPPLSAAPDFPSPQTSQFLSPRLAPSTGDAQYRNLQNHQLRAADLSPPGLAGATGSLSPAQTIRRLIQQNGRIREAWEAERKYLEANRERAEEVYKEERGLMEDERAEWETEREALLQQVASLQQQVTGLGREAQLPGKTDRRTNGDEFAPSQGLRGGDGSTCDDSPERKESPGLSQVNARPRQRSAPFGGGGGELPIAADTVAHGPLHRQSDFGQQYSGSRILPTRQYESPPFLPIASNGFPPSTDPAETADSKVPIVDVQEIIPTLEGIPIKAAAIQRHTFTDHKLASPPGSKPSSRTPSPPAEQARPDMSKRGSKEQTLRVLAADETHRLTMHAGHTPSHSLSVFPTVTASATTTTNSSGNSTPTMQQQDGSKADVPASTEPSESSLPSVPLVPFSTNEDPHERDHPEPTLEADEDVELKGPLMVRNMPAHDEIFFKRLSDKLEEVSKASEAAVPAVLKDSQGYRERQESNSHKQGDNDGAADAAAGKDMSSPRSNEGEEMEIPLKLRRSNNFGAPFGEFR